MIFKHFTYIVLFTLLTTLIPNVSKAGLIISAKGAFIVNGNSYQDIDNNLANTYNQSGLYDRYVNNVTDFDSYIASNPYHTSDYNNQEWFSEGTFASVVFDLGEVFNINAVALWNEESAGINVLDLLGSIDGVNFFNLASNLLPADNPFDENNPLDDYRYSAEVFDTPTASLRFVRFDMSKCPNDKSPYKLCSIGEVAFRSTEVPEPQTFAIFLFGLIGIVQRKKASKN